MDDTLVALLSIEILKQLVFQMHPNKAPGPNGLSPFFYQHFWEIVGNRVVKTVSDILKSKFLVGKCVWGPWLLGATLPLN